MGKGSKRRPMRITPKQYAENYNRIFNRKEIPNFPGYFVSKCGKIWSEKSGRFLKPWKTDKSGHLQVGLWQNDKRYRRYVHRLVLEAFVGPCPEGREACHNNGNPADNRLENLRWDTRKSKAADALRHGAFVNSLRSMRGEKNSQAKLNNMQVRIIKYLLKWKNLTQREIGKIFGVSRSAICLISAGKNWKHV